MYRMYSPPPMSDASMGGTCPVSSRLWTPSTMAPNPGPLLQSSTADTSGKSLRPSSSLLMLPVKPGTAPASTRPLMGSRHHPSSSPNLESLVTSSPQPVTWPVSWPWANEATNFNDDSRALKPTLPAAGPYRDYDTKAAPSGYSGAMPSLPAQSIAINCSGNLNRVTGREIKRRVMDNPAARRVSDSHQSLRRLGPRRISSVPCLVTSHTKGSRQPQNMARIAIMKDPKFANRLETASWNMQQQAAGGKQQHLYQSRPLSARASQQSEGSPSSHPSAVSGTNAARGRASWF